MHLICSCTPSPYRSLGGTIVTDICHHLGADVLSGAIFISSGPYLDLFPIAATAQLTENIPRVLEKYDVKKSREGSRVFAKALFLDEEKVPFATRLAWMGSILLMPPATVELVLYRHQDGTNFLEAAKGGLKVMCIYGVQDVLANQMAVVEGVCGCGVYLSGQLMFPAAIRPHFKDIKVIAIDQAGHSVFYEQPEQTNRALLQFVKECSA